MIFYGLEINRGTMLPQPCSDYEDDALQMAGNALFDSKGTLVYLYSSTNPSDRPSVEELLSVLRRLKT